MGSQAMSTKFEKLKEMFTKLAEQFKQHLVHYEANRTSMQAKLDGYENNSSSLSMRPSTLLPQEK